MGLSYLLDTNACAALLDKRGSRIVNRVGQLSRLQICVCAVVKAELLFGALKSGNPTRNLRAVETFLGPLDSHPFDDAAAIEYGKIRHYLESRGTPIGPNDTMIAAIARSRALVLITRNIREFSRVPDLRIEDWESPE